MDSLWSAEDSNVINNESLAALCWLGLLTHSEYWETWLAELSASHTRPWSFMLSESTIIKETLVFSFDQWAEVCPISSELLHNQSELCTWDQPVNNWQMIPTLVVFKCILGTKQIVFSWSLREWLGMPVSSLSTPTYPSGKLFWMDSKWKHAQSS